MCKAQCGVLYLRHLISSSRRTPCDGQVPSLPPVYRGGKQAYVTPLADFLPRSTVPVPRPCSSTSLQPLNCCPLHLFQDPTELCFPKYSTLYPDLIIPTLVLSWYFVCSSLETLTTPHPNHLYPFQSTN